VWSRRANRLDANEPSASLVRLDGEDDEGMVVHVRLEEQPQVVEVDAVDIRSPRDFDPPDVPDLPPLGKGNKGLERCSSSSPR
jgi:hypothetical protein